MPNLHLRFERTTAKGGVDPAGDRCRKVGVGDASVKAEKKSRDGKGQKMYCSEGEKTKIGQR